MLAPLSLYCTPGMSVESSSRLARALRRARPILHRVLVQLLSRRRRQSTGGTRARNPAPPPLPPARPRMKWGLRTAPTWRTATASTRERERERGPRSGLYTELPSPPPLHGCSVNPAALPLLPLPPVRSSVLLLTLLFVLHLAPEHRGALARPQPAPARSRSNSLQERRRLVLGRGKKMKKEGAAAGEGGRTAPRPLG